MILITNESFGTMAITDCFWEMISDWALGNDGELRVGVGEQWRLGTMVIGCWGQWRSAIGLWGMMAIRDDQRLGIGGTKLVGVR